MTAPAGHESKSANEKVSSHGPQPRSERAPPRSKTKPQDTMNGPLYMQTSTSKNVVLVRRLKRKDEGPWRLLARLFVENQIGLSFNLLALLFLAHACIPKARPTTRKFFTLSYYQASTGKYGIGFDDAYLIGFCMLLFTGLRAGCMEYILAPIGKWRGVNRRKDLTRFSEQAWLLVYYSVFWTLGMYIYYTSPQWMNLERLWTEWPDRELQGLMKGYVLAQWAFWLQQVLVVNMEERRKDHWQMLIHHFITISLLASCYSYHHTRVGNLILVLMDVVDLFLPLAKCLKYTGLTTLCDATFGIFLVSWLLARHVLYALVCWSVYADSTRVSNMGCYHGNTTNLSGPHDPPAGWTYLIEPFYDPEGYVCYNDSIKWAFLVPLIVLQVITVMWFFLIVRVAIRVLRGDGADDVRSDGEEEGEEWEEEEKDAFFYEEAKPLEEEVGIDAIDLKNWERRTGVKRQAGSTSVGLPGHSDRKELLGRIGCEKQVE